MHTRDPAPMKPKLITFAVSFGLSSIFIPQALAQINAPSPRSLVWPRQRRFDCQYGAMIGELDYYTHSDVGVLDWFRNNKPVHEKGYTTQLIRADGAKYLNAQSPDKPRRTTSPPPILTKWPRCRTASTRWARSAPSRSDSNTSPAWV